MNAIVNLLDRTGLLESDIDYHLLRAAMVIIFAWFGWDKWHEAEIRGLLPIITHGPLIFWTIPVLGIRGTGIFLGASEWTFGTLLLLGFWNKKAGILGALGSTATFIATFTVLPFVPNAWDSASGGFPSMTINSAFLLKDLVLLTVSIYLLKQDLTRIFGERPADSGDRSQIGRSPLGPTERSNNPRLRSASPTASPFASRRTAIGSPARHSASMAANQSAVATPAPHKSRR